MCARERGGVQIDELATRVHEVLPDLGLVVDTRVSADVGHRIADTVGLSLVTLDAAVGERPLVGIGSIPIRAVSRLPSFVWFHSINAGVDAIDLREDVLLTRTVGEMDVRMAEYVLAWVLAEAQNVRVHTAQQDRRVWSRTPPEPLAGSVALVFGTGRMGSQIARSLSALGVDVVGVSSRAQPGEGFSRVTTREGLAPDLARTRWVVNTLPLTRETENYFDADLLMSLAGASFINVGRGRSVQYAALETALDCGAVRTATLDVLPDEPPSTEASWWGLPRTTITSHSAALTGDDDVVADFVRCFRALESGTTPELVVDRTRGY